MRSVCWVFAAGFLALAACQRSASPPAHCSNHVRDGDETDVDCGGSCEGCGVGMTCVRDEDCASQTCTQNLCARPATCSDGELNGQETDVDCGGPYCRPCYTGQSCREDRDCYSGRCAGGVCEMGAC